MTPTVHTHCACFTHNNLPCCNMGHAPDAPAQLVAEVERLTVERDRARDIAVTLEQQTAEALRIALLPLDGYDLSENFDQMPWAMRALRKIVLLLETETQQ